MNMAPWGRCGLVFDSSRDPVARLEEIPCDVAGNSGTEFAVGRATSRKKDFCATISASKKLPSFCSIVVLKKSKLEQVSIG